MCALSRQPPTLIMLWATTVCIYSCLTTAVYHSLPGLHEKRPVIMLAVTLLKAVGIPLKYTDVHVASNTSLLIDQVVDLGWDLEGPAPAP